MNNRINELIEQSYQEVKDETGFDCRVFSKQRFAELIIADCLDCVDGYRKQRAFNTWYDAQEQIMANFGIKDPELELAPLQEEFDFEHLKQSALAAEKVVCDDEHGYQESTFEKQKAFADARNYPLGSTIILPEEDEDEEEDIGEPEFKEGDRVWVAPLSMEATVIRQRKSYDGPDVFWGNVEVVFDDGMKGLSNSWQLMKLHSDPDLIGHDDGDPR
jgi:hypothetical protein